jgi:hypothetical protein
VTGLDLRSSPLADAGDRVLSRLGRCAILIGAGLWLVGQANHLDGDGWVHRISDYVLLCCFSMACHRGALLRTRLLPRWVAWFSLTGGVLWLARMLVAVVSPLAPVIANAAPLVIGVTLLLQPFVSAPGGKTSVQGAQRGYERLTPERGLLPRAGVIPWRPPFVVTRRLSRAILSPHQGRLAAPGRTLTGQILTLGGTVSGLGSPGPRDLSFARLPELSPHINLFLFGIV